MKNPLSNRIVDFIAKYARVSYAYNAIMDPNDSMKMKYGREVYVLMAAAAHIEYAMKITHIPAAWQDIDTSNVFNSIQGKQEYTDIRKEIIAEAAKCKKQITVSSVNGILRFINRKNRLMVVTNENDYYFYIAPCDKLWATKRYSKNDYMLVVEPDEATIKATN